MLPSGKVTFLFAEVVGCTDGSQHDAHNTFHALLKSLVRGNGGVIFRKVGGTFCIAFSSADHALKVATKAQSTQVRMAVHSATTHPVGREYFGQPLDRAARILAVANAGQILVSETAAQQISYKEDLHGLGVHLLKDLLEPAHLWQFGSEYWGEIKSLAGVPHNLPVQTTSFVGRNDELAKIKNLFQKSRLVTLLGPGGTGKSRLSLQAAAEQMDQFPDGVWFCEFAPLNAGEDILGTIQSSMGISDGSTSIDRIEASLRRKQCLVIFDNCEHVLKQAAAVADALLSRCPTLTILTSSREPLGVKGETAIRIPTLPCPDAVQEITLEGLDLYGSTALFFDRFRSAAPGYEFQPDEAKIIVQICKRLDGIPLALELAAARGQAMSLSMIERRLDDRFRLIAGGGRNVLTRQQTLRALIDWSVDLLNEEERNLFVSLGVFNGSWNAAAVEKTCLMSEGKALEMLTAMVNKSLVVFDHSSERYHMLESIRQYAVEELVSSPNWQDLRSRHADHFLELCMLFDDNGYAIQSSAHHVIQTDFENFRGAILWTAKDPATLERAITSLCRAQYAFYSMGRPDEFARLLEPMLEKAQNSVSDEILEHAHFCLTRSYNGMGDARGVAMCHAMRDSFESLTPKLRELWRGQIGYSLFCEQRYQDCIEFFVNGQAHEELDSRHLFYIGQSHACLGRYDEAIAAMLEARMRGMGPEDTGGFVINLAGVLMTFLISGRLNKALPVALEMNRVATGNKVFPFFRGLVLASFGLFAFERGETAFACACAGQMATMQDLSNRTSDPIDQMAIEGFLKQVSELPSAAREPAFAAGGRLNWEPWFVQLMTLEVVPDRFPFSELLAGILEDGTTSELTVAA